MSSEEDPLAKTAEGVTVGVLNWSKQEIKALVYKLKNKDLAFIGDVETIETIKEEKKTAEYDLYNRYIKDKDLKILAQMGLALRKYEQGQQVQKLAALRAKIGSGYQTKGLHIAEFIQNELLDRFIGTSITKTGLTPAELSTQIEQILNNIDRYVEFIEIGSNHTRKAEQIKTKIYAHQPSTFIICSAGSAKPIAKKGYDYFRRSVRRLHYRIIL